MAEVIGLRIYNRQAALDYARRWAFERNPRYYDFDGLGGDCTNFISQCLYAGSGIMNYTPTFGWYYISPNRRTPSWSGVPYLYDFLTSNAGAGPHAIRTDVGGIAIGDVVQLGDGQRFYHSLLVVAAETGELYVSTHTNDAFMRPLSSYSFSAARFLHIVGVRDA